MLEIRDNEENLANGKLCHRCALSKNPSLLPKQVGGE